MISAYHMEQQVRRQRGGETSGYGKKEVIWKQIWKLGVPGAVKHFLWRLANNILPTMKNLGQRRVVEDAKCLICLTNEESVMHAIWWCHATTDVWLRLAAQYKK